jgi:hypothetical protein
VAEDTFFYAFVAFVIWVGLLGLIWPAAILWERLRGRPVTPNKDDQIANEAD